MKKIVTHKLPQREFDALSKCFSSYDDLYELVEERKLEQLFMMDFKDVSACFLYIDESLDVYTFESIVKSLRSTSLNVILKYQKYDLLMICYKYQVNSVFEATFSEGYLKNTIAKLDLLAQGKGKLLPTSEIVKLLSSPAKIKTNRELYNSISSYLKSFESIDDFSLLEIKGNVITHFGQLRDAVCEKALMESKIPKKFIGLEKDILVNGRGVIATPVFENERSKVWLLVSVLESDKSYILNSLFYKYLENVLIYRLNKAKEESLKVLANTDDVTGLYNQRKLSKDLENAVTQHEKQHEKFSIMFVDIDHFKQVNDNYGHVVGSKLLQDIGDVLSLILRDSDQIYRYGGDEFVVLMPSVEIKTVHEIASRILIKIKNKNFLIAGGETYRLSVSIGIAEYPTDAKSAIEIIQFADEMMYMSKRSGRGKVFHINEVIQQREGRDVDANTK